MSNRPRVSLVMVSSIDGVIAEGTKEFINWSSREDKLHFAKVTREAGCVIMGSHTFDTLGRPLKDRTNIVITSRVKEYEEKYNGVANLYFLNMKRTGDILEFAKNLGFEQVVLGGGSHINTQFAKENNIDYVYLSIEPHIAGKGINMFNDKLNLNLEFVKQSMLNNTTILLEYKVIY